MLVMNEFFFPFIVIFLRIIRCFGLTTEPFCGGPVGCCVVSNANNVVHISEVYHGVLVCVGAW